MMCNPKNGPTYFLCFFTIIFLTSCSAYMASQKKGVPFEEIKQCKTRSELITKKDVEVIETVENEQSDKVELCRILKEKGSYGRAAFNSFVSVFSLGLWEFAAYPMETSRNETKSYYNVKVYYDKEDNIKTIELIDY